MSPKEKGNGVRPLTVVGLARVVELAVRDVGLNSAQYRALSAIAVGVTAGAMMARFLDVRPSTVTTVLDGLETQGLVSRTRSDRDRRRVELAFTPVGRRLLKQANRRANESLESLSANLRKDEGRRAIDGLDLFGRAIEIQRRIDWGADAT